MFNCLNKVGWLVGGTIPPNVLVTALKPDIVIINERSQEVIILELTCPWDANIARSHSYKTGKYSPLVADLSHTRVVSFFSIEVSARGQVTKENRSRLKCFLHKCCSCSSEDFIRISSKTSLLKTHTPWNTHPFRQTHAPLETHIL